MRKLLVSGIVCLVSLWFSAGIFLGLPGATWIMDLVANAGSLEELRRSHPYGWGTIFFYGVYLPILVGVALVSCTILVADLLDRTVEDAIRRLIDDPGQDARQA